MKLRIDQATGALYCEGPSTLPGIMHMPTIALYSRGDLTLTARSVTRPRYGHMPREVCRRPEAP